MPAKPKDDQSDIVEQPDIVGPKRVLVRNVVVDGTVYGPAAPENEVTPDVEEKITNPTAWGIAPPDPIEQDREFGTSDDDDRPRSSRASAKK